MILSHISCNNEDVFIRSEFSITNFFYNQFYMFILKKKILVYHNESNCEDTDGKDAKSTKHSRGFVLSIFTPCVHAGLRGWI